MTDTPRTDLEDALRTASRWADAPEPSVVQQIQNLMQAYALFSDTGRAAELAALFTTDAVWDGRELEYGLAEGPTAIGATVTGHFKPGQPMMHMPGPPLLTAVGQDEVTSVSWCLATRWKDGAIAPLIHFYYEDVIVRGANDQWLFLRRRLRPAFPRVPAR